MFEVYSGNAPSKGIGKLCIFLTLFALVACAMPIKAQTTDLYVSNRGTSSILKISPTGVVSTFISGINGIEGLAFDAIGNLYAHLGGQIAKITPGGVVSTFASVNHGYGLTFDTSGNLYASNVIFNRIDKITSGGAVSTYATGVVTPGGLAFDKSGNLFVASVEGGVNLIYKITPSGVVSNFATVTAPLDLAFDADGLLYTGLQLDGTIRRITPDGSVSTFVSALNVPYGLAFDTSGNLYTANNATGTISKITPDGVVSTFATGLSNPSFIAFAPAISSGTLILSNPSATSVGSTSATITWKTNTHSDSHVDYGLTTSYGNSKSTSVQTTSHSVTLTGLSPSKVYNFRVSSTAKDQTAISSNLTFVTGTESPSISGGDGRFSYTIQRLPNGNYRADVKYTYTKISDFQATLRNANFQSVALGNASRPLSPTLPAGNVAFLPPGGVAVASLTFPASAGSPGATVPLRITIQHRVVGFDFGPSFVYGSFRVTLP